MKELKEGKKSFSKSEVLEISQKEVKFKNLDMQLEQFINEDFYEELDKNFKKLSSFWDF